MADNYIYDNKGKYEKIKKKVEIADDAVVQLKLSLEDLKQGRVSKF